MRRLFFLPILALFFFFSVIFTAPAGATEEGDAIRFVDNALVGILVQCDYTFHLKSRDNPVGRSFLQFGQGAFLDAADVRAAPNPVLTAGHVVTCDKRTDDELAKDFAPGDVSSFEIASPRIKIIYQGASYSANIFKLLSNGEKGEIAVLSAVLPTGLQHNSLPILKQDTIYDIGSQLLIRGEMPIGKFSNQSLDLLPQLKTPKIVDLSNDTIRLNEKVYPGMSGLPLLFFDGNRYQIVGIIVAVYGNEEYGLIDLSEAARLRKTFLDELNAAPPQ